MISQALLAGTPAPVPAPAGKPKVVLPPGLEPNGDFIDIVMLQLHVIMAVTWLFLAVIVAMMSVPRLRRIPSAVGLHSLQVHRAAVSSALWSLYLLALSTGIYLLFQQAAYTDPPWGGSDWKALESQPYAVPYFYALYAKIGLFALMGLATYVLSREAKKASKESEAAGGPKEQDVFVDDAVYDDYDDGYYGSGRGGTRLKTYAQTTAVAKSKAPTRTVHVVPLWMSVGVMFLGSVGIAFCVTLIKYFHELSKAAVVYEILKNIPG